MSNETTNLKSELNESIKTQLEVLKSSPAFFNMMGLAPTTVSWTIRVEDMENYVLKTAREYLGTKDVVMASINDVGHHREPLCYIWIKEDSSHLVDRRKVESSNSMVFVPRVNQYSADLRRFANNFAPTERPDGSYINRKNMLRVLTGDQVKNASGLAAIPVSLNRVLRAIFDAENKGFIDTYGANAHPAPCSISCDLIFNTNRDGEETSLASIKVTKRIRGLNNKKPRVVGSFRDSKNNDDD